MAFRSARLHGLRAGERGVESSTLRALGLVERIASADESPTLEALTRASGLPKPTVYRIVRLLMRGGLVEREVNDSARRPACARAPRRSPRRCNRRAGAHSTRSP